MPSRTKPTVEDAIVLAVDAHRRQRDKAGRPYALHVMRVMMRFEAPDERMTAVLHDVVEDSAWDPDRLRAEGFPDAVVEAVDCLTRRSGETYERFIERVRLNPLARRVKLADLEDNMNLDRLPKITSKDLERMEKYRRAWARLAEA